MIDTAGVKWASFFATDFLGGEVEIVLGSRDVRAPRPSRERAGQAGWQHQALGPRHHQVHAPLVQAKVGDAEETERRR